jgi:V8-like Glu-specific endopeptidase
MGSPFVDAPVAPLEHEVLLPDERVRVHATTQVPYRWVCSLDIRRGSSFSRGSGLLVGPRQVLTAAHNVYDAEGNRPDSLHVAPARNGTEQPFGRFEAVAFTTTSRYITNPVPGSRFDIALVTLGADASAATSKAIAGATLGHWGSPGAGQGTNLRPLDTAFLTGKDVVVCGYPGDKCNGSACNPAAGWKAEDQANTMWSHFGPARFHAGAPGGVVYTADTAKGQSGSPVWIRFTDGTRSLVGVHVDRHLEFDPGVRRMVLRGNKAVHLDADVMALVRSWLGQ